MSPARHAKVCAEIQEHHQKVVARLMARIAELKHAAPPAQIKSLAQCRVGPCDCDPHVEYCDQCAPFMFPAQTAPAQRLSDERVIEIRKGKRWAKMPDPSVAWSDSIAFARSVEAAILAKE
jgi:hypothetical protein